MNFTEVPRPKESNNGEKHQVKVEIVKKNTGKVSTLFNPELVKKLTKTVTAEDGT